jgi:two-component system cell cycle sensor histidine kinase/response regulator CckA
VKRHITDDRQKMREEAEARFARAPPSGKPNQSTAALLHELQVHQIELEMQNDEILRDHLEIGEAHRRLADLYDFAPVGYLTVSPAGLVEEANLTAAALLGVERSKLRGRPLAAFMLREDADGWALRLSTLLRVGDPQTFEVDFQRGDGAVLQADLSTRLRSEDGSDAEVRVVLTDIRARREAQEAARSLEGRLAISQRLAAMGTLVAGVAHEINNPLAGEMASQALAMHEMKEFAGLLRRPGRLDREALARRADEMIEILGNAQDGAAAIAHIVKDLVSFGRPDAERMPAQLLSVVESSMRWLSVSVERAATVRVENSEVPDVLGSAGQLQQVVVNLVTNAALAIPAGRPGQITIRIGPGGAGMVRLDVVDNGNGIPPEIMMRIFEPYFTTRDVGKGTGLGLAICHAIVAAHRGTLTVESEVGKGTKFRVELPAAPVEA